MSVYMLNDEDAIDDVNPFVTHDFSLPGSVRQTSHFGDFQEVPPYKGLPVKEKSVYCTYGLCADEKEPCHIHKDVHPRRNIDCGFTRQNKKKRVTIGVSNTHFPWLLLILVIALTLLVVRL